jgi:hypothetical protein
MSVLENMDEKDREWKLHWLRFLWLHRQQVLDDGRTRGWPHNRMSLTGYLQSSPDRKRPYNVIPANLLTMRTVSHDILAVADTGQVKWMTAESGEYIFPHAKWVHETPMPVHSKPPLY